MSRSLRVALLAALVLCNSPAARAEPESHFREGLRQFEDAVSYREAHPTQRQEIAQRFRAAAESFVAAWREGARSSHVLTNAGNSHYFAGDQGEAVLCYRRALALDPSNERALAGLEAIRQRLPLRPEPPETSLLRTLFFWHHGTSFHARLWVFCLLFPLAWAGFAADLLLRRRAYTQPGKACRLIGGTCLLVAVVLLGSVLLEATSDKLARDAVLLVQVRGRSGDGEHYSVSHSRPFPAGTEVEILERRPGAQSSWCRVRLPDDPRNISWVPAAAVAMVLEE